MSYFKAKMHQIRYRRWGSLQRSPDPLAGFKGPASKGRGEDGWREEGRAGRAGKGTGRERREREGKGIEKGSKGIGEGEEGKENGDRPPTIFGLKVALSSTRHHHQFVVMPIRLPLRTKLSFDFQGSNYRPPCGGGVGAVSDL